MPEEENSTEKRLNPKGVYTQSEMQRSPDLFRYVAKPGEFHVERESLYAYLAGNWFTRKFGKLVKGMETFIKEDGLTVCVRAKGEKYTIVPHAGTSTTEDQSSTYPDLVTMGDRRLLPVIDIHMQPPGEWGTSIPSESDLGPLEYVYFDFPKDPEMVRIMMAPYNRTDKKTFKRQSLATVWIWQFPVSSQDALVRNTYRIWHASMYSPRSVKAQDRDDLASSLRDVGLNIASFDVAREDLTPTKLVELMTPMDLKYGFPWSNK